MSLRKVRPGEPITAAMFNDLVDAVNRAQVRNVAGGGLEASVGPGGTVLRNALSALVPVAVYKTTTSITARSGATVGTGSAKPQQLSGNTLSDRSTATEAVKNILNKTVATSSYIIVVRALGVWWVVAVGDCGNLS